MRSRDPFGWVGTTIDGQFTVDAVAGGGGYGVVYRGTHLGLEASVAIKCLLVPTHLSRAEREGFLAKFRTEARLLHRLSRQTASIVQALDIGAATAPTGRWTPYIVMEWLEGETLEDELAARSAAGLPPRTIDDAIQLLSPVAEALSVAHEDSVSHRDVKPANLFLTRSRNGPRMKVLDFGIAKVFSETPSLSISLRETSEQQRVLTPLYAAPEQFSAEYGATGPWTDVFALALIVIEVATGRRPLSGDSLVQVCIASREAHRRPDLLSLSGVAAGGVDVERVEGVLRRALAPNVVDRFRSASELWSALKGARRGVVADAFLETLSAGEAAEIRRESEKPSPRRASDPAPTAGENGPPASSYALTTTGENRVCTVMLVDLSSVAELSPRLDGEELKDLLDRCLEVVKEHVEDLGGAIERSSGYRTIAVFGVPRATDNDAERAIVAALRMQAALGRLALPRAARSVRLAARLGIHTGRVFARMGADPRRPELSVVGDPVKVAARVQEAAPAGAITVTRDTHRQVLGRFNLEPLAPVDAPGRVEPVPCYRVRGAIAFQSSFAPSDFHGVETKLVGRAVERQRILEALETTLSEQQARVFTLVGAPGVGRSRLLAELFGSLAVRREHFLVLDARGSPLSGDTSYGLAAAILRRRFDIREGDRAEAVRRKLRVGLRWFRLHTATTRHRELLGDLTPISDLFHEETAFSELDAALAQLEGVLGTSLQSTQEATSITIDEPGRVVKQRIAAAVALLFRFVAQRMPIVMICDDLQWADDASLDLLRDVVQRGQDLPMFVVCSARPELVERRPDWGAHDEMHERVHVAALARRHIEDMIRDRLRRLPDPPSDLVRVLADRAEGNPLLLEETLHLLLDAGVIEERGEEPWTFHPERLSALAVPPTIQRIVQARLDRLDPEARSTLAQAAVVGRTFWQGALEHLRRADPESVNAAPIEAILARLRDRQLIRLRDASSIPGEREASFAESFTQEVAYETLSLKARRALHLLVAGWLEAQGAEGAGASASLLALHYDRGGAAARAAAAYARAAAHAASVGENAEALRHLERARALHDQDGADLGQGARWDGEERRIASFRDRIQLRLDLGDALRRAGKLDEAVCAYDEARARILRNERRPGAWLDAREATCWDARIDARLALIHKVRGSLGEACALIERAIARATESGALDETPAMYALLASLLRRERRPAESWQAARRGLRACRTIPRRDERWRDNVAWLLLGVAWAQYARHRMVSAERAFRQIARLLADENHPHLIGKALNGVAGTRLARGDLRGAREMLLRSLRYKERAGDIHELAIGYSNLAEVELGLGDTAASLGHARRAVHLGEQACAGSDLADMYRNLADASLAAGEREAALDAGVKALSIAEIQGRVYLGQSALTLAKAISRVARDDDDDDAEKTSSALRAKTSAADAALRAWLSEHLGDSDGELQRIAEECKSMLARHDIDP